MSTSSKFMLVLAVFVVIVLVFIAGRKIFIGKPVSDQASSSDVVRYLPLGDSYTIGESVTEDMRWPNQLATRLQQDGNNIKVIANPAVTGFTTQDLIDRELPLVSKLQPDFVTVLIGVNDYVQRVSPETFAERLDYILANLQKQLKKPNNIVLVTIPDYGKTPAGANYGLPVESEAGIRKFNEIIISTAQKYRLPVADIFSVSQKVTIDPLLTASDGLHPSGKQYTLWSDLVYKTIREAKLL